MAWALGEPMGLAPRNPTRRALFRRLGGAAGLAVLAALPTACAPSPVPPTPTADMPNPSAPGPGRTRRIGFLSSLSEDSPDDPVDNLVIGLRDYGYLDGTNLAIEFRFAGGQDDRLPGLVADLLTAHVDLIVLADTRPIPVAVEATKTVPLVMIFSSDPVSLGLVDSLARPGGNLTGLAALNLPLAGKRLEMLRDAVPTAQVVAVLDNPRRRMGEPEWDATRATASTLGLSLDRLVTETRDELDALLRGSLPRPTDALYVLPDVLFLTRVAEIVEFANRQRLPGMYGSKEFVRAGGLMTYVPDRPALFRRAAYYADRILKGTNPAELPIEQPTRFELVLNLRTAREFGLTIPPRILLDVTDAIE
jgi:putative tryptophan/tyrosine transport system substrate-binding protein